jgi:flagellin
MSDLAAAINNVTQLTGVSARLINPSDQSSGVVFQSTGYGSGEFVRVERLGSPPAGASPWQTYHIDGNASVPSFGPPFDWATLIGNGTLTGALNDDGRDVSALINGTLATGEGLSVSINSASLSVKLLLNQTFATDPTQPVSNFYITGGGALFQLGPQVTAQQQTNLGIQSIAASSLGGTLNSGSLEFLSSLKSGQNNSIAESAKRGDYSGSSRILDASIDEVSVMRGRLGAFEKNVLQTNVRSLQAAFENLSASESKIRDADFAAETSSLTRAQILQSAGTTVLGLANQSAQQVLQLLG